MSDQAGDPTSPYFGDHPDGPYFERGQVGDPLDDEAVHHHRRPLEGTGASRTPLHPYPIRMFAEVGCDFALWGNIDEPPPTRRAGPNEWDTLEEELPISDGLRDALLSWAQDYFLWDGGDKTIQMDDFDERGFHLSRQLQRELGDLYTIQYSFEFSGGPQRRALLAAVEAEPLAGWSCRD